MFVRGPRVVPRKAPATAGRKPGPRGCHALTKRGKPCGQIAMRGQRVCKMHGGKAPGAMAKAAERLERAELEARAHRHARRLLGGTLEVNPLDALLGAVREAAANVHALRELAAELTIPTDEELREYRAAFLRWQIGESDSPDPPQKPRTIYGINHLGDGAPHVLVVMYGEERDRLAKVAKAAIDAGATERMVALEEAKGAQVAGVISRLLDDPRLSLDAQAKAVGRAVAAELLRGLAEAQAGEPLALTA